MLNFILSALFLVAAISLYFLVFMLSSCPRIHATTLSLMLAISFPSLFDTFSLSTSSLGCKVSYMGICFFAFWSTLSISRMVPSNLQVGQPGVYLFDGISSTELCCTKCSRLSEILFCKFFLSSPLV